MVSIDMANGEAAEIIGLPVAPVRLPDRADYHKGMAAGQCAYEVDPEGKAAAEITALWNWLQEQEGMM